MTGDRIPGALPGLLTGQVALVTGAYRGIGKATALALAGSGAAVIVADLRDPAETARLIRAAGGHARSLVCDVADETSVLALFSEISSEIGRLDICVNCAGIIHEKPLLETGIDEFDRVIGINLRGTFLVGRESLRIMVPQGSGRLITIASDLAHAGRETFSPYVASKHGVLGLTRSWAKEFAPAIQVNALCPGPIDTEMLGAAQMSAEWRARELDIPLRRFGQPEEIAAMAVFLAGPGGAYVTGQGVGVNGGSVMP
jgi:3-oxoacyl-[acyl-carrier protein] reductase